MVVMCDLQFESFIFDLFSRVILCKSCIFWTNNVPASIFYSERVNVKHYKHSSLVLL